MPKPTNSAAAPARDGHLALPHIPGLTPDGPPALPDASPGTATGAAGTASALAGQPKPARPEAAPHQAVMGRANQVGPRRMAV